MAIEYATITSQVTSGIEADLLANLNVADGKGPYIATASLAAWIADNQTLLHLIGTRSTPLPVVALRYTPIAPVAAFTPTNGSPAAAGVGEDVQFTDASTDAPLQWYWDFGDGATSRLQNPTHAYAAVGSYTVTLRVTNNIGEDTATEAAAVVVS